jgi:hypothetical protein
LETIASSLLELRRSIAEALVVKGDGDSISERVATLELGRGLFEADMEGLLAKCEGKLKAANNAEARERTMRKQRENLTDDFDADGTQEIEAQPQLVFPQGNAPHGGAEPVQPVHVGVARNDKTLAARMKWL